MIGSAPRKNETDMRPLIAGNWKTNLVGSKAQALAEALLDHCDSDSVCVIPPNVYLERIAGVLSGHQIALGAQDVSESEMGATTGDVCAAQLSDIGCRYVLVGHSERRARQGESSVWVAEKAQAAVASGLIPIVCVGETLEQREQGLQGHVVTEQLEPVMARLTSDQAWVVAYEPVWAIGTGKTASPEQAQEVHALIRNVLKASGMDARQILYGGSVNATNAPQLSECADVDGALVGGAALNSESFAAIVAAFTEHS